MPDLPADPIHFETKMPQDTKDEEQERGERRRGSDEATEGVNGVRESGGDASC